MLWQARHSENRCERDSEVEHMGACGKDPGIATNTTVGVGDVNHSFYPSSHPAHPVSHRGVCTKRRNENMSTTNGLGQEPSSNPTLTLRGMRRSRRTLKKPGRSPTDAHMEQAGVGPGFWNSTILEARAALRSIALFNVPTARKKYQSMQTIPGPSHGRLCPFWGPRSSSVEQNRSA